MLAPLRHAALAALLAVTACAPLATAEPPRAAAVALDRSEPAAEASVEPASAGAEIAAHTEIAPPAEIALPVAAAPEPPPAAPAIESAPRDRVRAVVLVYHLFGGIDSEQAVETEAFEEQLRWLADHHVPVIGTSELMGFLDGTRALPERAAVIQIDDGHVSVRARAFPVLQRLGVRFTLALNTEAIEGHRPEAVTWDAVREMLASGLCEIASHSHIHGHMDRLTEATNKREVELSRSILEARTGVRPEAFVYPFGGQNDQVRKAVADAGYRAGFGVGGGAARATSPRFRVPRVGVTRSTTLAAFARIFGESAAEAKAPRAAHAPAG